MIRHIVLWELIDPARADEFAGILRTCAGLVDGMRTFEVTVRDAGGDSTCDVALVSSFDDAAALQAYLDHPVHREASRQLGPMRRDKHVVDAVVD